MYPVAIDQQPKDVASAFCVPSNARLLEKEITKVKDQKPQNKNIGIKASIPQQIKAENKVLEDGKMIKKDDSTKEILSKLQGEDVGKTTGEYESDKESEGISKELESAFQNLSLTTNSWDEGTQI